MKYFILSILTFISSIAFSSESVTPTNEAEFKKVTVKITNMDENSGGTGVILNSYPSHSIILTNKHICEGVLEEGGVVKSSEGLSIINSVRMSTFHDLCMIMVIKDLKYRTIVADSIDVQDDIFISGHPDLYPRQTVQGKYTGNMIINMVTGIRPCTPEEEARYGLYCLLSGGVPILTPFEAWSTSAIIAPGNSGSPVFDDMGKLVALAFAGSHQGLSFGLLVPLSFIKAELKVKRKWTRVPVKKG